MYGPLYAVDNTRYIFPFLQDLVGCGRQLLVLALFVGVSSKPFLFLCFFDLSGSFSAVGVDLRVGQNENIHVHLQSSSMLKMNMSCCSRYYFTQ